MDRIVKCTKVDYNTLSEIWERSVRSTHEFLPENIIKEIKDLLIPMYFPNVDLYAINNNGCLTGFMGLANGKIEMLFIDCNQQGLGYGSELIDFAKEHGATRVDVNEQNPAALNFYKSKGFQFVSRDEKDENGRPYPILHLALYDEHIS